MPPSIVDGHLHLWDLRRARYPWMEDPHLGGAMRSSYLVEDFMRDSENLDVRATVHVQAEVDHSVDPVEETAWLATLAAERPEAPIPTVCVGYADLRSPDLADILDRHQEHALFRGVRQEAWFDPQSTRADILTVNLLDDPAWVSGLAVLARRDLVFDLLVFRERLPQAAAIFSQLPELRVVLEHFGLPGIGAGELEEWERNVAEFAARVPQALLKISGIALTNVPWTVAQVRPLLHRALEIFGPERCFFASNWPVESIAVSYEEIWGAFDEMSADLTEPERTGLFSGNAARIYGIALEGEDGARTMR